jgi:hypothetical protein
MAALAKLRRSVVRLDEGLLCAEDAVCAVSVYSDF